MCFFDVRVFSPYAPSNRQSASMSSTYRMHERVKKRQYSQCILEVEHGMFTPLVTSLAGRMGRGATVCYKCLASQLAVKWDQPYNVAMGWLQCSLSYSLLRSSIQCLHGARSSCGHVVGLDTVTPPVDLIYIEARV